MLGRRWNDDDDGPLFHPFYRDSRQVPVVPRGARSPYLCRRRRHEWVFPDCFGITFGYSPRMAEIVDFVNRGAMSITPGIVEKVLRHLPQWKLEFTQIYEPLFPHLVDQLEFIADAVEDTAEGAYKDLPYAAFAQAVFALLYAHKKVGIIPDTVLNLGRADDSSVVRAVLIQNEKVFAIYAASQDLDWSKITSEP